MLWCAVPPTDARSRHPSNDGVWRACLEGMRSRTVFRLGVSHGDVEVTSQ